MSDDKKLFFEAARQFLSLTQTFAKGVHSGCLGQGDAKVLLDNAIHFERVIDLLSKSGERVDAESVAKLAVESQIGRLSPFEEGSFLVILERIKAEAKKGFFSTTWNVLDPEGNMSGRIWHQLRMRGFTVDASSVSWPKE